MGSSRCVLLRHTYSYVCILLIRLYYYDDLMKGSDRGGVPGGRPAGVCRSAIRRFEIRASCRCRNRTAVSRWGGGLPVSRKKRPHVAFRLRLRSLPFPFVSSRLALACRLPFASPRLAPAAAAASALPSPPSGKFPNPSPNPK
jgi:hypothetical protein